MWKTRGTNKIHYSFYKASKDVVENSEKVESIRGVKQGIWGNRGEVRKRML